jgi:hypothetical protein
MFFSGKLPSAEGAQARAPCEVRGGKGHPIPPRGEIVINARVNVEGVIGVIDQMKRLGILRLRHLRFTSMSALPDKLHRDRQDDTEKKVGSGGASKPQIHELILPALPLL